MLRDENLAFITCKANILQSLLSNKKFDFLQIPLVALHFAFEEEKGDGIIFFLKATGRKFNEMLFFLPFHLQFLSIANNQLLKIRLFIV